MTDRPGQAAPVTGGLGFGCAELFRLPSARERRRILDAALDAGVAHFDVAPMYGLGAAERELGSFARGRRDRVVIATKFGIDVTVAGRGLGLVQGPVRRVLEARPGLRARAKTSAAGPATGSAGSLLYRSSGYGASAARASLERSLRALATDHVDLLLLHDPTAESVRDDVGEFLEDARTQGLLRAWGIAGEPDPVVDVARRLTPAPSVLQVRDDVFERSLERVPPQPGVTRVTFGSLGSAVGRIVGWLEEHPTARERWRVLLGCDCGDPEVVAALLLRHARLRNPDGVTLFSTIHAGRIRQGVAAAAAASMDDVVAVFAGLVDDELSGSPSGDPQR
jgi:D-threo-aldose 1-dehydrogenase